MIIWDGDSAVVEAEYELPPSPCNHKDNPFPEILISIGGNLLLAIWSC